MQGHHGEFEPGKAQHPTPNFFDRLFLIRNPKSWQGPGLGGALPAVAALTALYLAKKKDISDVFSLQIEFSTRKLKLLKGFNL